MDRVQIYQDTDGNFRWQRLNEDHEAFQQSIEFFPTVSDAWMDVRAVYGEGFGYLIEVVGDAATGNEPDPSHAADEQVW